MNDEELDCCEVTEILCTRAAWHGIFFPFPSSQTSVTSGTANMEYEYLGVGVTVARHIVNIGMLVTVHRLAADKRVMPHH